MRFGSGEHGGGDEGAAAHGAVALVVDAVLLAVPEDVCFLGGFFLIGCTRHLGAGSRSWVPRGQMMDMITGKAPTHHPLTTHHHSPTTHPPMMDMITGRRHLPKSYVNWACHWICICNQSAERRRTACVCVWGGGGSSNPNAG